MVSRKPAVATGASEPSSGAARRGRCRLTGRLCSPPAGSTGAPHSIPPCFHGAGGANTAAHHITTRYGAAHADSNEGHVGGSEVMSAPPFVGTAPHARHLTTARRCCVIPGRLLCARGGPCFAAELAFYVAATAKFFGWLDVGADNGLVCCRFGDQPTAAPSDDQ